ncbi:MAG: type II toxin-antitoxin system HicA family toxin [Solidesulfovibrio sp. DCME]|uniref:type II toxin-antitoxin system HicA family toxin n=1 Tax=Solidesulfovibrio sp. DCME TaxID=3447380 RepID=UPI003D11A3BF
MPSSKDILKRLKDAGWYVRATKGDHVHLKHPEKPGKVTVPDPVKDIDVTLLKKIEKQAGMKLR